MVVWYPALIDIRCDPLRSQYGPDGIMSGIIPRMQILIFMVPESTGILTRCFWSLDGQEYLRTGQFGFVDTKDKKIKGDKKLECELTIKDGQIVYDLNGISNKFWNE